MKLFRRPKKVDPQVFIDAAESASKQIADQQEQVDQLVWYARWRRERNGISDDIEWDLAHPRPLKG